MNNTPRNLLLVWALATSVSMPVNGQNNQLQTLMNIKRGEIVTSVNNLLHRKWKKLKPGEHCVITVYGKEEGLKVILACNQKVELEHAQVVNKWEKYVTQVTELISQNDGTLNQNQWCLSVEAYWEQVEYWSNCLPPDLIDQKSPRKKITIKA